MLAEVVTREAKDLLEERYIGSFGGRGGGNWLDDPDLPENLKTFSEENLDEGFDEDMVFVAASVLLLAVLSKVVAEVVEKQRG